MSVQRYIADYDGGYLPFDPNWGPHQKLQRVVKEEDYVAALKGSHAEKAAQEGGELLAKISLTLSSERLHLDDIVPKIEGLQTKLKAAEAVVERLRALVPFAYGEGFVDRSSSLPPREDIGQGWHTSASFKGLNHADSQAGEERGDE